MAKKYDLPAMPFYFGDWRKAPEIRALPLDTRMVWFEMLGFMWESTERGYLTINNKPINEDTLAMMLGIDKVLLKQKLEQLLDFAVYSIRETDGAIYCRKMVRDEEIRNIRKKAGSLGGKKTFAKVFAQAKNQANAENEIENEIEDISNKREGRFYKLIPLKFQENDEFWEAWKNWYDLNVSRGTDLLPKQAKEQLTYLETHPDPIGLLKQAFANGWKGIIYKGKENKNGTIPIEATQQELQEYASKNKLNSEQTKDLFEKYEYEKGRYKLKSAVRA